LFVFLSRLSLEKRLLALVAVWWEKNRSGCYGDLDCQESNPGSSVVLPVDYDLAVLCELKFENRPRLSLADC
jgi:hypothetical protein